MGLQQLEIFYFFQYGDNLHTSESDVYRRQVLKCNDVPHGGGVNPCAAELFAFIFVI